MEDREFWDFVKGSFRIPCTRQIAIEFLRNTFRYYEGQAGKLWELSQKRKLTQAEELRYRQVGKRNE